MSILEFDSIEKSFGERKILSSIYMRCERGKVVALLGRNGAGKSTLMKIFFGSLNGEMDSVRLNKQPLLTAKSRMTLIGYLPQSALIPNSISVTRALRDFEIPKESLIDFMPVFKDLLNHKANQLSGGLHRVLEVFLIVRSKKIFVILDEPFSGIMPIYIDALKNLIQQEKFNKGIIISDHLYRHTLEIADTTYLLKDGKTYPILNEQDLIRLGYLAQ